VDTQSWERVVDMWLNSPEHYEIMITNSNGFMGVGVSKGIAGILCSS
jgi:uncharacterized protein YkwD